jgi:uncharacterized protein (DUF1330 family)
VADIRVTDPVGYEEYRAGVAGTIAAHGGRYLARGGEVEVLEGTWEPNRMVVLEFPNKAELMGWYDSTEYRQLRQVRQRCSEGAIVIVEGV